MPLFFALALTLTIPSEPYSWRNVQIVGGGFVSGIITNPKAKDMVYCRTDIGGAYRLDPKSRKWIPLLDWLTRPDWNLYGVESLATDPSDPNRVYIAAGTYTGNGIPNGAILRSRDKGKTWLRTDLPFRNGGNQDGRGIGERLMVDPRDSRLIYFGTRNDGLWKSTDSGVTWAQDAAFPIKSRTNNVGVGWVSFGPGAIYVGVAQTGESLFRSLDHGATWQAIPGQPAKFIPHHGGVDTGGNLYVTFGNGVGPNGVTDGAVWRMSSTGAWTDVTPLHPSDTDKFGYAGLSFDPRHPGTLVVSTLDRWGKDTLWRTRDGGTSWVSIAPTAVLDASISPFVKYDHNAVDFGHWINDVEIDPFNPDQVWYGTGATIWTTADFTAIDSGKPTHWAIGATGVEENAVIDLSSPTKGAAIVSGLGDIGGFRHEDMDKPSSTGVWTNPYLGNVDDLDFAGLNPDLYIRVGRGSATQHGAYSTDNARTWQPLATDPPDARGSGSAAISADGSSIVWAPQGSSGAYVTRDLGRTWTKCEGAERGRILSDKVDPKVFYIQGRGSVWVSHDGGITFAAGATGLPANQGKMVPVFNSAHELWLPTDQGLYRSGDAGVSFVRVTGIDKVEQIGVGRAAPGKSSSALYVIGTLQGVFGVFRSIDDGTSWVRINDAATGFGTMDHIEGDPKVFGRVYLGTNGRGVLVGLPRK